MRHIRKYRADEKLDKPFDIVLPIDAKILTVKNQSGLPYIFAIVDDKKFVENKTFIWIGELGNIDDLLGEKYIGSVDKADAIYHLFQLT